MNSLLFGQRPLRRLQSVSFLQIPGNLVEHVGPLVEGYAEACSITNEGHHDETAL